MVGAVSGFVLGFILDSVLLATLGISSLTLLTVGYLAGRYREGTQIANTLMPPIMIGVLTIAASAAFSALQLMLGIDTQVSLLVLREIFVQGLLAFLFAIPLYPLIRRVLRPGDRRRRRRRPAHGVSDPLRLQAPAPAASAPAERAHA